MTVPMTASAATPVSATNGFEVWPAALKGAAGTFDAEATAVSEASKALSQQLVSLGQPWGKDSVGQRFGGDYSAPGQIVLDNVAALSVGLARIAAALRAVADNYQRGEDDLITPLTRAAEEGPGS